MELQVLMVDDHPPIIEGYKSILSFNTSGYVLNTIEAYSCEMAYFAIIEAKQPFDMVFLDLTLPPYLEKNLYSGEDLIQVVKNYHPLAKIILLTSHTESMLLFKVIQENDFDGILLKNDFRANEFIIAFDAIIQGKPYYSQTILKHKKMWSEKNKVMDDYNRQILMLLSQGVKTKSIPHLINLSVSAVDKRKAMIKQLLGIEKGNDEDILKEARRQGLI